MAKNLLLLMNLIYYLGFHFMFLEICWMISLNDIIAALENDFW